MRASASSRVTLRDDEIGVTTILGPGDPRIAERRAARPVNVSEEPPVPFRPLPSKALTTCLSPISAEEFGAYWGRRHLHIPRRGQADRFRGILSLDALDALLAEDRIPRATISVLDARKPNRSEFEPLDPRSPIGSDLAGIGASLYFHFIDQFSPTLRDFCDDLETSLGMSLAAFAFLNPPDAQARALHWDPLDVIILQVEGEKVWDIHAPHVNIPLEDSTGYTFDTPRIARVTLEPGDTLYVPRGFIHKAESTHDISFSITLGVLPVSWHQLLETAATRALRGARGARSLRSGLPAWSSAGPEWSSMLDAYLELIRSVARPRFVRECALDRHREFEGPKFHVAPGYLTTAYVEDDELEDVRYVPTKTAFRLGVTDDGRSWELKQNGSCFLVSGLEADSLRWMRKRRSFTTLEVARRFPKIDPRKLLQRLLAIGFIRAASGVKA